MMNNLFDMMMQAQGGAAVQNMARQFGLAPEQARSAVEAVLPAFQIGLQQQAQTVDGFQKLLAMFGAGQFGERDDAPGGSAAQSRNAMLGNDVLGQIFGGKDISRAVAAQAAADSGVSDAIIMQMLPVMASLLMSGLFKGAMNNGLGGLMGQTAQGGLGDIMGRMMGGASTPAQPNLQNATEGNLFGGMLGQILGGMTGAPPTTPPPPPDPMSAGMNILRGMFDTGQQVQRSQMDAFQAIFERFSGRR